jgi:2-polyprenyl-6-hydroxyphenyl methylase/3-demethylubiquinone-9 3-methyltransferase
MPTPSYSDFRDACTRGLSCVRPLVAAARENDPGGWNFGTGWPPSYAAFGRLRFLQTLELARGSHPARVLELAAGDGALGACLARTGAAVVVNDLREGPLRTALAAFDCREKIDVAAGNIFDLVPARLGQFDLVIACEVIEHVARPIELLRHVRRFLAPRGQILLTTPNGSYFRNRLPTLANAGDPATLESRQFMPDADGHLFLITPDELRVLAREAGLAVSVLELFGSPAITGHCGLSMLQSRTLTRACYIAEAASARLPESIQRRMQFAMAAMLGENTVGL